MKTFAFLFSRTSICHEGMDVYGIFKLLWRGF